MKTSCREEADLVERIRRDYYPDRSPDVIAVPKEPNYFGGFVGTSHSGPWDYIQKVPVVFYGPGYIKPRGEVRLGREGTVADIAPTIAELLDLDWPGARPGRVVRSALVAEDERLEPPRLIVTVVWDGGGTNVLRQWPREWPNLRRLMVEGTAVSGATAGSSPSVTPAIHANIGTGAFPAQHGIVDIDIRSETDTVDSFHEGSPQYLERTTLGDLFDAAVDNESVVGMLGYNPWHYGMMSHGSFLDGGDKDIAALIDEDGDGIESSERYYYLPDYIHDVGGLDEDIRSVDREDGTADGLWLGNDSFTDAFDIKHTPAFALYQTRLVKALLSKEDFGDDDVPDLFFVNYKPIDLVGHVYNMLSEELRSTVRHTDEELGVLVDYLNQIVGRNKWVIVVTADHGQTPLAESNGAWPIFMEEVERDLSEHLGIPENELFWRTRPGHFWFDHQALDDSGVTLDEIANFFVRYTLKDNIVPERPVRQQYQGRLGERAFSSAWPSVHTAEVWGCVIRD